MTTPKTARVKKTSASSPSTVAVTGKLGDIVAALSGEAGASIEQLTTLTGWQKHSVRGAMAGALKKRGFSITSVKVEGVRTYRIAAAADAQP